MKSSRLPFIPDLLKPLHAATPAWRRRRPAPNEISLVGGVRLQSDAFPQAVLETAYADFGCFLQSAGIPRHVESRPADKAVAIRLRRAPVAGRESYCLDVSGGECVITAEEPEGIRRGLIFLEDEMLRRGAPVLPRGAITRRPFLKTRMHLGHIALMRANARAAGMADGLLDGMPDAYLNRVAHDGANAIWTTPAWLGYPGRLTPADGRAAESFLRAARQMVERYARYGIKVYFLGIVPEALHAGDPLLKKYPELRGQSLFDHVNFCTSSAAGRNLLTQAMERLFRDIPGLGGFINICVGERPSHCYSGSAFNNNCPRCSRRAPHAVLADTLAAMARGIRQADPQAELVAWPYMQNVCWGERLTADAASRMPPGVTLMHNFENGGHARQLGKMRRADDYWLSYAGPADLFVNCARAARRAGTPIFAKAMVAGSHELASVPCIPAPGLVYRKIAAMRKLGVSGILANWGSSNDPSVMQRAAGDLAFEPFPESEKQFLLRHARRDWQEHAGTVARAWGWFARAYRNYPLTIGFSYYGPMHNGAVWELNLIPRDIHLPRSWQPDPPVGDRIGDCTGYHTLDEIIRLCTRMRDDWGRGVRLLAPLMPRCRNQRARLAEIALAQALELHFISGVNILEFYRLREQLADGRGKSAAAILAAMRAIVGEELSANRRLLPLALAWPRLGYTPEAGIYKYNPALIRKRMASLRRLLRIEFPAVAARLRAGKSPWPECAGNKVSRAGRINSPPAGNPAKVDWAAVPSAGVFAGPRAIRTGRTTQWQAAYDGRALYFNFICREPRMDQLAMRGRDKEGFSSDDRIWINIETSQFEPMRRFMVNPRGARDFLVSRGMNVNPPLGFAEPYAYRRQARFFQWRVEAECMGRAWRAAVRIPFQSLGLNGAPDRPLRINVGRDAGLAPARELSAWVSLPPGSRRAAYGLLKLN